LVLEYCTISSRKNSFECSRVCIC